MQNNGLLDQALLLSVVEGNEEHDAVDVDAAEDAECCLKNHLEAIRQALQEHRLDHEILVHHGDNSAGFIIDDAKKVGAIMIVIGKHGVKEDRRVFLPVPLRKRLCRSSV